MSIQEVLEQFSSGSSRKRRSLIPSIEKNVNEIFALGKSVLEPFDQNGDDWSAGLIIQLIQKHYPGQLTDFLDCDSNCWFNAPSEKSINYAPLQDFLIKEDFEQADRLTSSFLRELAGESAVQRGYVYYSEVKSMTDVDLLTIDRLWTAYSRGKFGFTVQSRLLKSLGGRYELLWPRIGWKKEGVWTRYPKSFTWDIKAPEGHMPLINQLRGVRLMDAILNHPALVIRQQVKPSS